MAIYTIFELSDDEVATLNAARTLLTERYRPSGESFADGALYTLAVGAEHAIFQLLNWSHAYGGLPLNDEQIHNRPSPVV